MSTIIHPTAIISNNASIGKNSYIGPYCIIEGNSSIGENAHLHSHITISKNTTIGKNAKIYPYASIGMQSQDLKYKPENKTYAEIGDNVIIRESVTIHRGTEDNTKTSIGNNCALLTLSHIGHNCEIGNNVIISHNAGLAGHVTVDDYANVGAMSGVHQFSYIGKYSMLAALGRLSQDICPFTIAEGTPSSYNRVINKVGMQRNGFSDDEIAQMREIFKMIFKQDITIDKAKENILAKYPNSRVTKIVF